ncbi:MAG: ATP-grasp domain-containing protein [Acetobacter sp.]|nr:ATP-grasp domain-containing protein [Bacteroides sp.]MCM1341246.1 ATP-grasp domain-containing protein [Acetobacter sp.]MCM1433889.1 ATP-grasp domain-containing protein [Clostridiales bacterium]
MYNILIFPAGTEIGLEIYNALKFSKMLNVIGATSATDHARMVYKNIINDVPFVTDDDFIEKINNIVRENNIDFIYPAHDSVCLKLTEHQNEIDAKVVTSALKTVDICRSKAKTYSFFAGEDFIPKTFADKSEITGYPVFVKPSVGQGSNGAIKINSEQELDIRLLEKDEVVICEYLSGTEYTIDCFTDIHGKLRVASLRDRIRTKSGISMNSRKLITDSRLIEIAETINSRLEFNGAWFFQLKRNNDSEYKLLEISPRIPGTMGLSRNRGINFPVLTIYNMLGYEVDVLAHDYDIEVDRALINRYTINQSYSTVYVDLDDTLELGNKVNQWLLMFLYQCVNERKKIVLISRHARVIDETLKKHKVSKDLFDEIIHLKADEKKSDYIKEKDAIFIDDSFRERKDVMDKCGINVFDLDEIEALIDWKNIGW